MILLSDFVTWWKHRVDLWVLKMHPQFPLTLPFVISTHGSTCGGLASPIFGWSHDTSLNDIDEAYNENFALGMKREEFNSLLPNPG